MTRGDFDRGRALEEIPLASGILRDVFQYIASGQIPPEVDWIVDDLVELLRPASLPDFSRSDTAGWSARRGTDPVLHFYETFLRWYDPVLRKRRGVFYTPLPIVSWM